MICNQGVYQRNYKNVAWHHFLTKPEILVGILKLVIRFLQYASKSVEMEKLNLE